MNVIQIFYPGTDGHIWTRWRRSDGKYTEEKTLYGTPGSRIAFARVPGSGTPQLFYKGSTHSNIFTRWRNPDGTWSGEQKITASISGNPVAAQVPGTEYLQIFYQGTDSGLDTVYRNPDGSWSAEQHLGGILTSDPAVAQVQGTNILQVFYRGNDDGLYSRWRKPDGSWSSEQSLGGILNGAPVAAHVPGTNTLAVFYRGKDNSIYSRSLTGGAWSSEVHIGGVLNGDPIAIQVPGTNTLQLFYRGTGNIINTRWLTGGTWSAEQSLGGSVLASDPVAIQVPGASVLQLFYQDAADNSLWTRWRNADGSWSGEQKLGGALNAGPVAGALPDPVPATYTLVLMLWGPPQLPGQTKWQSTLTAKDLGNAMSALAASTYFSSMAQYAVKQVTVASVDPPQLSTPKLPPGNAQFTTLFTVATDIASVVTDSIANGAVPKPDSFGSNIPVYIVITPRGGSATDAVNSLGEHLTMMWGPANTIILYAYAGAQSDLNDTLNVVTHELVEAIGNNSNAPKELCDDCQTKYGGGVSPGVGSYTAASYFDTNGNQCVAPPNFAKPA